MTCLSYNQLRCVVGLLLLLASIPGFYLNRATEDYSVDNKLYELPKDCDFMAAANNSTSSFECSPKLHDSYFDPFLGILINGPAIIEWPSDVSPDDYIPGPFGDTYEPFRLMISGIVQLKFNTLGLKGSFYKHVFLVAVDRETAQTYTGKIQLPDFLPEPADNSVDDLFPERPVMSEEDMNKPVPSHFNIDLVHNLRVPIKNASYTVYATLGPFKSNVLTIETRVK